MKIYPFGSFSVKSKNCLLISFNFQVSLMQILNLLAMDRILKNINGIVHNSKKYA